MTCEVVTSPVALPSRRASSSSVRHGLALRVDADRAVERLHAGRERGRRGGGVGHRLLRDRRDRCAPARCGRAGSSRAPCPRLLPTVTSRIRSRCAVPIPSPCSTITLRATARPRRRRGGGAASVHVGTLTSASVAVTGGNPTSPCFSHPWSVPSDVVDPAVTLPPNRRRLTLRARPIAALSQIPVAFQLASRSPSEVVEEPASADRTLDQVGVVQSRRARVMSDAALAVCAMTLSTCRGGTVAGSHRGCAAPGRGVGMCEEHGVRIGGDSPRVAPLRCSRESAARGAVRCNRVGVVLPLEVRQQTVKVL